MTTVIYFLKEILLEFSHNNASGGGAVFSGDNSYISFEGNSVTEFSDNIASFGGAMFSEVNSHMSFQGSSATLFSKNNADHKGGAIMCCHYSYISLKVILLQCLVIILLIKVEL